MRTLLAIPCLLALLLVPLSARADEPEPATSAARPDELRVRLGFSGSIGVGVQPVAFLPGVIGVEVRAGAQLSDLWAVLYQGSVAYGSQYLNFYGAPAQLLTHSSSILGEVTLADMVQIALGPSLGFGSISDRTLSSFGGVGGAPHFQGGMGVGFSHRVAVTWGGTGTGTRQGFSLGLNLDALWLLEHGNAGFGSLRLAFGWESF